MGYNCPLRMNMDKIVKKMNNNKKASKQSNQTNQISIKDYCIEGGKIPKQNGQKRDSSQRSLPEDLQQMKKMELGNNTNNESDPSD